MKHKRSPLPSAADEAKSIQALEAAGLLAPKPNLENALIRALRASESHLRKLAEEFRNSDRPMTARDFDDAAYRCNVAISGEMERMRAAGEASS